MRKDRDLVIRSDLGLGVYMGLNSGQSDLVLGFVVGLVISTSKQ